LVEPDYLEKVLRRFVEYSILDTRIRGNSLIYRTTNRARYLLNLVKTDPYLIHTLILDTELPMYIWDKYGKNIIQPHKHDYSDIGEAIFRNVIVAVQTINSVSYHLYKQIIFEDKNIEKLAYILDKSNFSDDKKENILQDLLNFGRDKNAEYDVYIIIIEIWKKEYMI